MNVMAESMREVTRESAIDKYYALLDGPHPINALDVTDGNVRFLLDTPAATVHGRGRDDLAAYITGRNTEGLARTHHVLRRSRDNDLEFLLGEVREGGRPMGSFLAVVRETDDGTFDRYVCHFQTDLTDTADNVETKS